MSKTRLPVFIGSILLERNRWKPGRQPTYRVSEWVERWLQAGFDGVELWENHASCCLPEELAALEAAAMRLPMKVFSAYVSLDEAGARGRADVARLAAHVHSASVKYNFGPDPAQRTQYTKTVRNWLSAFPSGTRLTCECHGGTIMEDPAAAREVFDELADERFDALVHPFTQTPESLRSWFHSLGPRITHSHVQARDENGRCVSLEHNAAHVRKCVSAMLDEGFCGSFTLEFTKGVGAADEDMDDLYRWALRDLEFLRSLIQ